MQDHSDQAVGSIIGAALGFFKSFTIVGAITWSATIDTAELAAIGALTGLLITSLAKWTFKRFTKRS